jgi:hypothetical protein
MRPVKAIHTALQFQPQEFLEVKSAQPELVTQGWASGLKEGVGDSLKGITAAYVGEREKKEKAAELTSQREHEEKLANIRAASSEETPEEKDFKKKYNQAQLDNLESQIESRKKGNKKPVIKNRGSFIVEPEGGLPLIKPKGSFGTTTEFSEVPAEMQGTGSELSLRDIPLPSNKFQVPIPEDIFSDITQEQLSQNLTDNNVLLAGTSNFSDITDTGGRENLQAQTMASAITPKAPTPSADVTVPTDAEQIAQLSEQQMPVAEFVEPPSIKQVRTQDLLGNYEDYEEALMARKELASRMPDYDIPDVTEEVLEDGTSYFSIKAPKQKPTSKKAGVPEGMIASKGKIDAEGNVTLDIEPAPEVKQQIAAIKKPLETTETMLRAIGDIRRIYEGWSPATGFAGSILQWIEGSDAADVRKLVKTLQGNIAFKTLADMKAASPTGGALGAVSERELDMLAAAMGSIDPGLSHFLFKGNLDEIERILKLYKQEANSAISQIEKPQNFTPIQTPENRVEVKTQAEFNALKSGQKFIFNGRPGTK